MSEVEHADREAFIEYLLHTGFLNMADEDRIKRGEWDNKPGLLVFARHRTASVEAATADLRERLAECEGENARLRDALTPCGSTKAAYHGEFAFEQFQGVSDAGIDQYQKIYVPWTTTKEIMAAILKRAKIDALLGEPK